jgi:hypothetical protein
MSARLHNDPKPGDYMCERCYTHFRYESGDLTCQQCGNIDRSSLLPIEVPKTTESADLDAIESLAGLNGINGAASGNNQPHSTR